MALDEMTAARVVTCSNKLASKHHFCSPTCYLHKGTNLPCSTQACVSGCYVLSTTRLSNHSEQRLSFRLTHTIIAEKTLDGHKTASAVIEEPPVHLTSLRRTSPHRGIVRELLTSIDKIYRIYRIALN
ncbi:hypothetical protein J6590_088849 [Homalodisca vitripennis]|nr:hypothetical protein J6590_088849 [Homalodisca vitripennis]